MLFRSAQTHAARVTTLLAITAALGAGGCTFAMEMGAQQPEPAAAAGGRTAAQSEPSSAAGEPTPAESERTPAEQAPASTAGEELELNGVAVSVGSLTGSLRLAD